MLSSVLWPLLFSHGDAVRLRARQSSCIFQKLVALMCAKTEMFDLLLSLLNVFVVTLGSRTLFLHVLNLGTGCVRCQLY